MRLAAGLLGLLVAGCMVQAPKPTKTTPAAVVIPTGATPPASTQPEPVASKPPVVKADSDWPQFLGPNGNSTSPETGIIAPWPKEGLRLVWQLPLGSSYGAPAISQGKLFVCDRVKDKAILHCLNSRTAETIWEFSYPTDYSDEFGYENGPRCCPVVDGDRVYMFGAEGMLHCLSTADGKEIWKADTTEKFNVRKNFFGVGSTPIVEGDLLIVMVGGCTMDSGSIFDDAVKPNNAAVVAFDKKTGDVKWKSGNELASYACPVIATIHGKRWCFAFCRGGLLGLDVATGKVEFHYPWRARTLECVNASNPVVVDDRVFITECYGPGSSLLKVKPGGVDVLWNDADKGRDKSMQCHWNTPIYHEGFVYGSSGRHEAQAQLRCVDLATGKVAWSQPGMGRSSLLMIDGHFICHSETGELYLLKVNPKKYDEISKVVVRDPDGNAALLKYPCWAAPVVSHGLLYLRGKNRLVCLELIPQK